MKNNDWKFIVRVNGKIENYYKTFILAQMNYHNLRLKSDNIEVHLTEIEKDGIEKTLFKNVKEDMKNGFLL